MNDLEIYIKNMVCPRCIWVVETQARALELDIRRVSLGLIHLNTAAAAIQRETLAQVLTGFGFEILDCKKQIAVEAVKNLLIQLVHDKHASLNLKLSFYIEEQLKINYSSVSKLFSELEGNTIERYFIAQKIELAKEWLTYNEYQLSEIADRLQYSSVAHLSQQFKKTTGISPTAYKNQQTKDRKFLDDL